LRSHDARASVALAAGAAIVAALVLRPLLLLPGLPGLHYDWSWPPDAGAAWGTFVDYTRPYVLDNFGHWNFYAGGAPAALVDAIAVQTFGAVLGLKAVCFALVAGAAAGAYALARRLGAAALVACACAIAFAASPVVAHEAISGHVAYLFGYAMLPFVAIGGLRLGSGESWVRASSWLFAAIPLGVAQPQFAVFYAAVLFAFVPFALPGSRARTAIAAALALAASPLELTLALFAHPLAALRTDLTNAHWLAANSTALWIALLGATGIALWAFAIWNVARDRRAIATFALALVATLLCAGANGPLWPAMSAVVGVVPQLAFFRELYHFAGLAVFGVVAMLALTRGRVAGALALAVALLFAAPQAAGASWPAMTAYDPAPMATLAAAVAADPGRGRVLFWPLLQPLGPSLDRSGADPDAFRIGTHPALYAFSVAQPLSQLATLICDPSTDARALLRSAGVSYVVWRPQWRSQFAAASEPALRPLLRLRPPCRAEKVLARLRVVARAGDHRLLAVDAAPQLDDRTLPFGRVALDADVAFAPDAITPDPRKGWTDGTRWQWWGGGIFMGPVDPGVFALGGVPFALPSHGPRAFLVLAAPAGARFEGAGPSVAIAPTRGYVVVAVPPSAATVRSSGAMMLAGLTTRSARPADPHTLASAPVDGTAVAVGTALQYAVWALFLAMPLWALLGTGRLSGQEGQSRGSNR